MDLKELKKEVQELPNIEHTTKQFRENWLKPYHKDTHLPKQFEFLKNLDPITRTELNKRLADAKVHLDNLQNSQILNEKLHQLARHLVELKLTTFNGDTKKAKAITRRLVNDEVLSIAKTVEEINDFEERVAKISDHYQEINILLDKRLSLEEALYYLEIPHHRYLQTLQKTAQHHKAIARSIERQFTAITKEASLKNVPHK